MKIDITSLNLFFPGEIDRPSSATAARINSFKIGYLCAMAVKMGHNPEELRAVIRTGGGTTLDGLNRLHKWMEKSIEQLPDEEAQCPTCICGRSMNKGRTECQACEADYFDKQP